MARFAVARFTVARFVLARRTASSLLALLVALALVATACQSKKPAEQEKKTTPAAEEAAPAGEGAEGPAAQPDVTALPEEEPVPEEPTAEPTEEDAGVLPDDVAEAGDEHPGFGLEPGTPFAALFDAERVWTYNVEHTTSFWDDQDPAADEDGNVTTRTSGQATCRMTHIMRLEEIVAGTFECTPTTGGEVEMSAFPTAFAMAVDGMWVSPELPAEADGLAAALQEDPFMTFPLEEKEKTTHPESDMPDFYEKQFVKKEGGLWCVGYEAAGGDEAWRSDCFDPSGGWAQAKQGWAGGSIAENVITLVP